MTGVEDGALPIREVMGLERYKKELGNSSPVAAYTFEV